MQNSKGAAPTVKLNSGFDMPVLGLGTWTLRGKVAEDAVYVAIKNGYRLIDTAKYYDNEEAVGKGIRRAIDDGLVKREDLFVTSKLVPWSSSLDEDRCSRGSAGWPDGAGRGHCCSPRWQTLLASMGFHGGPRWPCSTLAFLVVMPHRILGRCWVAGALGPQLLPVLDT